MNNLEGVKYIEVRGYWEYELLFRCSRNNLIYLSVVYYALTYLLSRVTITVWE